MKKLLAALTLSLSAAALACGCGSISVRGVVRDKPTGNPIASATISVGEDTAVTDGLGVYRLDCKAKAESVLLVNASGYFLYSASLAPRSDESRPLIRDFELVPRVK